MATQSEIDAALAWYMQRKIQNAPRTLGDAICEACLEVTKEQPMPNEIDESYIRMIRKLDEIELDDLRHGRDYPCMFKPGECAAMGTLGCEACGNNRDNGT